MDDLIEDNETREPYVPLEPSNEEPSNKGYIRMTIADFASWNAQATITANQNNFLCESYTYYLQDTDPAYCWARVEHDFISDALTSKKDAIEQGMIKE